VAPDSAEAEKGLLFMTDGIEESDDP